MTSSVRGPRGLAVLDELAALVDRAGLQIGDRLPPEVRLAQSLGVGRSTMREALKRWEGLGLIRRRRGESDEAHIERLRAMWSVEKDLAAEAEAVRRAARYEATGGWRHSDEPPPPELPPLELVTGWSRASGRPALHEGVALFGGWRIGDMEKRKRARAG